MTHEEKINSFIPEATKIANKAIKNLSNKSYTVEGADGKPCTWDSFSFEFHKAMNRLTSEAGLRILRIE